MLNLRPGETAFTAVPSRVAALAIGDPPSSLVGTRAPGSCAMFRLGASQGLCAVLPVILGAPASLQPGTLRSRPQVT